MQFFNSPVHLSNTDVEQAVLGGVLIAASSSLNMFMYGRVTGLSGMLNSVREGWRDGSWMESFLVGLVLPAVYVKQTGFAYHGYTFFDSSVAVAGSLGLVGWVVGGLLTGLGTKLANGCTSGHGVCGLPQFSKRSLAAVLTFCGAGAAARHVVLNSRDVAGLLQKGGPVPAGETYALAVTAGLVAFAARSLYRSTTRGKAKETLFAVADGMLFGAGLLVSGMLRPSKVLGFLSLARGFDAQLVLVLGTVVVLNTALFAFIKQRRSPLNGAAFPRVTGSVDTKLVVGSALFGMGWAVAGLCPGPGAVSFFTSDGQAFMAVWMAAFFFGQHLAVQTQDKIKLN